MFRLHRHGREIYVSGFVSVQFDWSSKPETLSAEQVGVTNALAAAGFDRVRMRYSGACGTPQWDVPHEKGWYDGTQVVAASDEAAAEAEAILRDRIGEAFLAPA